MVLKINRARKIEGEIEVPGDKSISHRSLILGALAEGESQIKGLLEGEDCLCTLKIMQQLGVEIKKEKAGRYLVKGRGLNGLQEAADVLDCGNSGTSMRLLTGLLAAQDFYSVLTGDKSLRKRPMARIINPLSSMGAQIYSRKKGLAPLTILGTQLTGIEY
jgi:3-phosphoshikimate 1-carboxyvinyltransferase